MKDTRKTRQDRRTTSLPVLLGALAILVWLAASPFAAEPATKPKLIVGTKVTPPFAMKNVDGAWYGISIDLWRGIMKKLNTEFEWRELDLKGLLSNVESGSIDAAVAALTITAQREAKMDFTHPFYRTGLSIAVNTPGNNRFLTITTIIALTFFAIGFAMWFGDWIRHRRSDRTAREIRTGFLLVALVVIVSSLIAHIITFINLNETKIEGIEDLHQAVVATVPGSTSEHYLRDRGFRYKEYPALAAGLHAVAAGEIDAMLYDTALLRYLAKTEFKGQIKVLPLTFELQEYGIALPSGSPLRESVNHRLIAAVQAPGWQALVDKYLAESLNDKAERHPIP